MHPGTAEGIRYTVNTTKGKRRRQSAICRTPRLSRVTARLRPEMDALPAYTPGRTVPGAIKIASNETVDGPLPSVREAIVAAMDNINRYPDNGYRALRERLAAYVGFAPEQISVGCGSVSLCQQVIQISASVGDEVVIFGADGPSADDWAAVCGTIGYEIVTRIGPRVPRVILGGGA